MNRKDMFAAQTSRSRIPAFGPFPSRPKLPNGPGDLARRCLMLRWRQTDFFCA